MHKKNRKNILIVVGSLESYSETFIHYHINSIDANIFLLKGGVNKCLSNYSLEEFSFLNRILIYIKFKGNSLFKEKVNFRRFDNYLLKEKIKRLKIDSILAEYGPLGLDALPFALSLNIPLVVCFRGYDAHLNNPIEKRIVEYRRLFNYAKAFVCVSQEIGNILIKNGCLANKIIVQPSGADQRFFGCKAHFKNKNLIMIGRFDINKGHYFVLLALKHLISEFSDVRLNIVGDGELKFLYEDLVKYLEIESYVNFLGVLNKEEIAKEFENSYALIHPAYQAPSGESEGAPNVVLEAQAAGLPVIVSDIGGLPEIVENNVTGLVIPNRDINALIQAIRGIFIHRSYAERMGESGKENVKNNFTREHNLSVTENALGIIRCVE